MVSSWVWLTVVISVAIEPTIGTVAGTGQPGDLGDGGPAVRAQLNQPFDVAWSSSGDIYFSDTFNHRIRRIDRASGRIATIGGDGMRGFSGDDGPAIKAQLDEPYGIAVDSEKSLFFADRLNRRVRRIDARTGVITTVAGNGSKVYSGDGGQATNAGLVEPNGVALSHDGMVLFIADVAGHRVRRVELATGVITTFAGNRPAAP